MRVLHLSWEYPPVVYGGLGRHVHALAEAQAAAGADVVVLTQAAEGAADDERVNGVRIVRVRHDAPFVPLDAEHLIGWVFGFSSGMSRGVLRLMAGWRPDVIHGHDWMVAHSCVLAAQESKRPFVLTVHATEAGRHQGWLPNELSRTVHGIEAWGAHQASRVIACSEHMRWEVTRLFEIPADQVTVIPNGVDPSSWRVPVRLRRAARDTHPGSLVVFTGRLEWEKGVHTLIDAMALVRRAVPDARLVIAGRGSQHDDLVQQARRRRLGRTISFEGWLPERELHALVAAADVAVVPSIYEPFGMVALEAAAVGTALVVARSGGLAELVQDGATGWTFEAGDDKALASCLIAALTDPAEAARLARAGRRRALRDYGWARIAEATMAAYRTARAAPAIADDHLAAPRAMLDGNLLLRSESDAG